MKMAQVGWDFTYDVNTNLEVIGTEEGHLGSFDEATIVARITQSHYDVKYLFLVDADEGLPLIKRLPVGRLRPIPPNEYVRRYELGDEVDCEWRDGYWFGRIIGSDVAENKYYVKFPLTVDKLWAHHS